MDNKTSNYNDDEKICKVIGKNVTHVHVPFQPTWADQLFLPSNEHLKGHTLFRVGQERTQPKLPRALSILEMICGLGRALPDS